MISENERHYAEMVLGVIDTVECPMLMCEGEKAIVRKALKAYIENNDTADTPQTESTGSPIGDYRDGVGAWQTERMTEEEIDTMLAKALVGQTDCGWGEPNE